MNNEKVTLRVMGVPEHFNTPWILAIDDGAFDHLGVGIEWTDAPGGSGQMARALFEEEADLALLLTEGAVNSLLTGNPCTIHSTYVDSPLLWGVFAGGKSTGSAEALHQAPFLVSRRYSGSHLMGFLYADQHERRVSEQDFTVVGDSEGAIKALDKNPEQLFLWEKFISMPLVDKKKLRLTDTFSAPWPAFVAVVRNEVLEQHGALIDQVMAITRQYAADLEESEEEGIELVAHLYDLKVKHAREWMQHVRFSRDGAIDSAHLVAIGESLHRVGVLDTFPDESRLREMVINR
jgi:ABC-type nitrate/sulfonate/bicarbonate transport system substrate-binding protein